MAEEKDYKQSNKERMLLALSLLFPEYKENAVWDWSKIVEKKPLLAYKVQYVYDKLNLGLKVETSDRLPEKTILQTAAKISQEGFHDTVKQSTLEKTYGTTPESNLTKEISKVEESKTTGVEESKTTTETSKVEESKTTETTTETNKPKEIDISNITTTTETIKGTDESKTPSITIDKPKSSSNKPPPPDKPIKISIDVVGYYKILGTNDEKTCPNCKKWQNKIICINGSDPRYPTYDEFLNDHIFHPNCRCSLHPVNVPKPNIERLSMNTNTLDDELLYTGFMSDEFIPAEPVNPELCKPVTYDYGETLVQLTPIGNFKGWDGEKPVDQIIDDQAIDSIINDLTTNPREILVDIDHGSCRSPNERDTQAAAWAYDFKHITELGNLNGLYCRLKWTSKGRSLVENREYRFLSPVWTLNTDNRPSKLISIGLTNRPAIKSKPIINTIPEEKTMTEEEIKTLVNSCMEETKKEITNSIGEPWTEEKITELVKKIITDSKPKEEPKKAEEKTEPVKKEEVIKEEVLNTEPNTVISKVTNSVKDNLMKLKGDDFIKYASEHKKELLENW